MTSTFTDTIRYITSHLLGANGKESDERIASLAEKVGYTKDEQEWHKYKVVIYPSPFFDNSVYGTKDSLPKLPLKDINGTPIIYGDDTVYRNGDTLVVKADIIASAYFMMARYEEYADSSEEKRDQHGRFIGKKSFACKAGLLATPIVEEYGKLLRAWLREVGEQIDEPKEEISHFYITHDLDMPLYSKTLRGLLGAIRRGEIIEGLKNFNAKTENNKYFTFPMLKGECDKLRNAHKGKVNEIAFIKSTVSGKAEKEDNPIYCLKNKHIKKVINYLKENGFEIGLHTSYYSGKHTDNTKAEAEKLRAETGLDVTKNRYHYLRTLLPQDYKSLETAGITDDFTLGYADVAGFRTGTCREYRWINPENGCVSETLWIHPMIMMDCTIGDKKYMALSEYKGLSLAKKLIDETKKHNGEATILFHNSVFCDGSYDYEKLYKGIITELRK